MITWLHVCLRTTFPPFQCWLLINSLLQIIELEEGVFQEHLLIAHWGLQLEDTYTLVGDKLFLLRRGNPDVFGQDQLQ